VVRVDEVAGFARVIGEIIQELLDLVALGTITDLLGETILPIPADRPGLLLGLRTFPRTFEGESVAVILENPK
jgi:hypothetical protein